MLFNSFEYLIFLPVIFVLYWLIKPDKYKWQNVLLLIASYTFYGFWDYRFLFLLLFSTLLDYFTGLKIFQSQTQKYKKGWLLLSIIVNLGFLGFFKYYNFFIESFSDFLSVLGFQPHLWTLKIILPVGISFYTFHGLSYVLDIYNGKIKPTKNIIDYSLFISFFPLLVAGPIERATHLLPQLQKPRSFSYENAVNGLKQILWGLFKKVVIADNCASVVYATFAHHESLTSSSLIFGAVLLGFQIYGDFSGYSDIALGSARLLGVDLLKNFNYPFFSRDIAEFWRRWHISLTSWFRDYLFIPLGGSRVSKIKAVRNSFIVFFVTGFWHGANWTFIVWGLGHAVLYIISVLINGNRYKNNVIAEGRLLPTWRESLSVMVTFTLVTFGWIFVASPNLSFAFSYIGSLFSSSIFQPPIIIGLVNKWNLVPAVIAIIILLFLEWFNRTKNFGLDFSLKSKFLEWTLYIVLIYIIIEMGGAQQEFIYFQF